MKRPTLTKKIISGNLTFILTLSFCVPNGWSSSPVVTQENQPPVPVVAVNLETVPEEEVNTPPVSNAFDMTVAPLSAASEEETPINDLQHFDDFMGGIAREGVEFEEVLAARNILVQFRETLQAMIDNGEEPSAALLEEFQNRLDRLDEVLRSNPIIFKLGEGPKDKVEVLLSDVVQILHEEYSMLGVGSGIDFNRLPGISPEDMAGHETFFEYLKFRQPGAIITIPIFSALSAYGETTLAAVLLNKYGLKSHSGNDNDQDGIYELNYEMFRRYVIGLEQAAQEAREIVDRIARENSIAMPNPQGLMSWEEIKNKTLELNAFYHLLRNGTLHLFSSVEESIQWRMESEINEIISQKFQPMIQNFMNIIETAGTEIQTLIESYSITKPTGDTVSYEDLEEILEKLHALHAEIINRLNALSDSLAEIHGGLQGAVFNKLSCEINGCFIYDYSNSRYRYGYYDLARRVFDQIVSSKNIQFEIPGKGIVVVTAEDLNTINDRLPRQIFSLSEFPGIKGSIPEDLLKALESQEQEQYRTYAWPGLEKTMLVWGHVSRYAIRIQFTQLFLEAHFDKIVREGRLDRNLYWRTLLMDESVEEAYDSVVAIIQDALEQVQSKEGGALSVEDYLNLRNLMEATQKRVIDIFKPVYDGLSSAAQPLIMQPLSAEYTALWNAFSDLVNNSKVQITIDGNSFEVKPVEIHQLMLNLLNRVAILGREPTSEQYRRLNGITESLLGELWSPSKFGNLRYLNFSSYYYSSSSSYLTTIEIYFRLIPEVLESFGSSIIENGAVSMGKVQEKLLEGVYLPVPAGDSLKNTVQLKVHEILTLAQQQILALDFSKWEERIQWEEILRNAMEEIRSQTESLRQGLNESELRQLESLVNYGIYQDSYLEFNTLAALAQNRLASTRTITVPMQDGSRIQIDLNAILAISGLPYSMNYDKTLLPGFEDSDFENAENFQSQFSWAPSAPSTSAYRSIEKVIVNIAKRLYDSQDSLLTPDAGRMFTAVQGTNGIKQLVPEVFRRYVKGIDALHQEILQTVEGWVEDKIETLKALETEPMTLETLELMMKALTDFQAEILTYLQSKSARQTQTDIIEIEEAVTALYQRAIQEWLNYMENHTLIYLDGERQIEVPVNEFMEKVLNVLKVLHGTEDIAAHHFLSLYGLSVEDVQNLHKLENFLGMQIIALPRNSQMAKIDSKISSVGFMQLIVTLMSRYKSEVVREDGTVDVDTLIDILTDPMRGFEVARNKAQEIANEAHAAFQTITGRTTADFMKFIEITETAKIKMMNTLNGLISHFSDEQIAEIQASVQAIYDELCAARDQLLFEGPIPVTALDESVFDISFSEEMKEEILNRMMELVTSSGTIWNTDDSFTNAGFWTLVIRLAERYGKFVVDESGNFSVEKFMNELGRSDNERAEEIFDLLENQAIQDLNSLLPETLDGPVTLEMVEAINQRLTQLREDFLKALRPFGNINDLPWNIRNLANAAWGNVMKHYEDQLFSRTLVISVNGRDIEIDIEALQKIVSEEYANGQNALIDLYKADGESYYAYDTFKTLVQRRYYWDDWYIFIPEFPKGKEIQDRNDFLTQFTGIPGILWKDLENLETELGTHVTLMRLDAKELLESELNMRVFSPGTTIALSDKVVSDSAALSLSYYSLKWLNLSSRDILFRLIPEIVRDFAGRLVERGKVSEEKFRELLRDPEAVAQKILKDMRQKARDLFSQTNSEYQVYQEELRRNRIAAQDAFRAIYNAGETIRNLYRSGGNILADIERMIQGETDLDLSQYSDEAKALFEQLKAYYTHQMNLQNDAKAELDFWTDAMKKNPEEMVKLKSLRDQILEATDPDAAKALYAEMQTLAAGLPVQFEYDRPIRLDPVIVIALTPAEIVNRLRVIRSEVSKEIRNKNRSRRKSAKL